MAGGHGTMAGGPMYVLERGLKARWLGVIFAALIVAAIPTVLIFVFCQNIIMRGIVVPVEK